MGIICLELQRGQVKKDKNNEETYKKKIKVGVDENLSITKIVMTKMKIRCIGKLLEYYRKIAYNGI